jgi:hypothetical protein
VTANDHRELLRLDLPKVEAIRAELPAPDSPTDPAIRMQALGDPTRLLRREGQLCVCDPGVGDPPSREPRRPPRPRPREVTQA